MRKWLFWSFGRGSFQYDVLCGLILIAIFSIPPALFNDRPDHMRLDGGNEIQANRDDDGDMVYTVKVNAGFGADRAEVEREARVLLRTFLASAESDGEGFEVDRVEAVYNIRGGLAAYSFWVEQ
jgi:hypothetical protein